METREFLPVHCVAPTVFGESVALAGREPPCGTRWALSCVRGNYERAVRAGPARTSPAPGLSLQLVCALFRVNTPSSCYVLSGLVSCYVLMCSSCYVLKLLRTHVFTHCVSALLDLIRLCSLVLRLQLSALEHAGSAGGLRVPIQPPLSPSRSA